MFLPQNLKEYLESPMGKGSTAVMNKQLIVNDLNARYEKLLKKKKDFKHTIYFRDGDYYFHFKIPSETERNNDYDVVIMFTMGEDNFKTDVNIKRYYLKFFSNCPSFTYTFAYAYNDNGLLIDFLQNKYDDIVLANNPVIRNPSELVSYEKSLYFACKYIDTHQMLLNKVYLSSRAIRLTKLNLPKNVRTSASILIEIKKEENRIAQKSGTVKKKEVPKKPVEDKPSRTVQTQQSKSSVNIVTPMKKVSASRKITGQKKIAGRKK